MAADEIKLTLDSDGSLFLLKKSGSDGIKLKAGEFTFTITSSGIELTNGSGNSLKIDASGVKIDGTQVDINSGNLTVMK